MQEFNRRYAVAALQFYNRFANCAVPIVDSSESEDLMAVDGARQWIEINHVAGGDVCIAFGMVYASLPEQPRRGAVHQAVLKAAKELHAEQRTIYYWLNDFVVVFCHMRRLRMTDDQKKRAKELGL